MFGSLAKGMKDSALAIAMKSYMNDKLSEYGEVLECQVDTSAARVSVRVLLRGEGEPVTAAIERYELDKVGEDRYIVLKDFSCSREWVARLMSNFLAGKRYKLPGAVANFL